MRALWTVAQMVIKEIFRKKDFYVVFILIGVILFYAAGLRFYNTEKVVRYLLEIGLLLIFLFSIILTVTLAAQQVPREIQNRTIHPLLAKAITRGQFVFGKYLGCFLAGASAFTIFYVFFIILAWSKAGELSAAVAFQTYALFLLGLMVITAITSALSYGVTSSANISISLVVYVLISAYGANLRESAQGWHWTLRETVTALYFILPHFEFFDLRSRFVHGWGVIPTSLVGFLALYAFFYSSFFLFLAWASFRRRPL